MIAGGGPADYYHSNYIKKLNPEKSVAFIRREVNGRVHQRDSYINTA